MHYLGSRVPQLRFSYDVVTYPRRVTIRGMRRHRLADWTPQLGDVDEWLTGLAKDGWVPEHRTGAEVVINGRKVLRFALVETDAHRAAREAR